MNMRLVKNGSAVDPQVIRRLAVKTQLPDKIVELLYMRSLTNADAINVFLNPDVENFYDPFIMKGMREAVGAIEELIASKEERKVLIFGDYDADGVCSAAILSMYLSKRGLNIYPHIPDRQKDGYGLNVEILEKLLEDVNPDLILTCDCGISAVEEVEFLQDLGVPIIVTDHHEVGEQVPDCIVVNPHQTDCKYPYKYLCGAGVAFKFVQALGTLDDAMEYIDLVALATVADLMPLTDENRLIVQFGLEAMTKRKNLGLKAMLDNLYISKVTSSDVAFKIAPRVNAAGRMGSALRAFELFTGTDIVEIKRLVMELEGDNNKRRALCDSMYNEALQMIKTDKMLTKRALVLSSTKWEKGVTGILAARIANEFNRVTFIIVESKDGCKGTCRSIEGINLYELLTKVGDLLLDFGGHMQAAGFSIAAENIEEFSRRVNALLEEIPAEKFLPTYKYDMELTAADLNADFARALQIFEPTGSDNPKPLFLTDVDKLSVSAMKNYPDHLLLTFPNGQVMRGFNSANLYGILKGEQLKKVVFDMDFSDKTGLELYMRKCLSDELRIDDNIAKAQYLKCLNFKVNEPVKCKTYAPQELNGYIDSPFSTLIIAGSMQSYEKVCACKNDNVLLHEFLSFTSHNNYTRIIIAPQINAEFNDILANYTRVIFADTPPTEGYICYVQKHSDAEILVPEKDDRAQLFSQLDTSHGCLAGYYKLLIDNQTQSSNTIFNFFARVNKDDYNLQQFVFAVSVFTELGIINLKSGNKFAYTVNKGVKVKLDDSSIYRLVQGVCNGSNK